MKTKILFFGLFLGGILFFNLTKTYFPAELNNGEEFFNFSDFRDFYKKVNSYKNEINCTTIYKNICKYETIANKCEEISIAEFCDGKNILNSSKNKSANISQKNEFIKIINREVVLEKLNKDLQFQNSLGIVFTDGNGEKVSSKNSPFDILANLEIRDKNLFGENAENWIIPHKNSAEEKDKENWTTEKKVESLESNYNGTFEILQFILEKLQKLNSEYSAKSKTTKHIIDYMYSTSPTGSPKLGVKNTEIPETTIFPEIKELEFFNYTDSIILKILKEENLAKVSVYNADDLNLLSSFGNFKKDLQSSNQNFVTNVDKFFREKQWTSANNFYKNTKINVNNYQVFLASFLDLSEKILTELENINSHPAK